MTMHQNLIGGEWVGGKAVPNVNPAQYRRDRRRVRARPLPPTPRRRSPRRRLAPRRGAASGPLERHDVLSKAAAEILARKDELGRLLAREEGKTLPEAIGETLPAPGRSSRSSQASVCELPARSPSVGPVSTFTSRASRSAVVGVITPWNFPIAIPAWKIAPALAYGNTVVFKPADLVPGCAWALVDILHRAGVPKAF